MTPMKEAQARALFSALTSINTIGQDLIVAIETRGATPSPTVTGQIHNATGGHLSILVESGGTVHHVPIGWDVIESVNIHIEP